MGKSIASRFDNIVVERSMLLGVVVAWLYRNPGPTGG